MARRQSEKPVPQKLPLHGITPVPAADELTEFRLGFRAAFEPPRDDEGDGDQATTTLASWWNHLQCETCGHTFRRGDRVRLDATTSAVSHLDPALECGAPPLADSREAQDPRSGADLAEFADGIDATWPPAGGTPVIQLSPGDWRTSRPRPPLPRARCLYCGHTFRNDEHVIICPCSPAEPACGAAVHRDPAAGLVCWESWQPTGEVRMCPVTSTRRPQPPRSR